MNGSPAPSEGSLSWPAILASMAVIVVLHLLLSAWIVPAEGEYRPGFVVALVALLVPGYIGGWFSGLVSRTRHLAHAATAGLLVLGAELVVGATAGGMHVGPILVEWVALFGGATSGGAGAAAWHRHRSRSGRRARHTMTGTDGPLLEVDQLTMNYRTSGGRVSAVDNVSFRLGQGQALGLVGESGCGKTSVAMSLMRLAASNAEYVKGRVLLDGADLLSAAEEEMRRRRWADIAMIFQGAMNAWNPVYTVYDQIREAMITHSENDLAEQDIRRRVGELFELVGLDPAMADRYPHEFSGGMRQRAVIAMSLACDPKVIIADEPTTALDVIVQGQILREMKKIQNTLGTSIIYISHDIAVIAEVTELMGVMYAGRLVELGPTEEIFAHPRHPYTHLLLRSTPSITGPRRVLAPLEGEPPDLVNPPPGCRFHPRCPYADQKCREETPSLDAVGQGRRVACWRWTEIQLDGLDGTRS